MTTLSRAKPRTYEAGGSNGLPVAAATIIYEGAAVGLTSTGYARPLTSADTFAGFAKATANNSAGAAAAINVDLVSQGSIRLAVTSAAITDVGQPVYATDDDTFTLSGLGGAYVGEVKRFVSSGIVIVSFDAHGADVSYVYDEEGNIVGLRGAESTLSLNQGYRTVLFGDSMTDTYETVGSGLTGAYDSATGILTITLTTHVQAVGWYVTVWNRTFASTLKNFYVPILTRVDANNFTVNIGAGLSDVSASDANWFCRPDSWRSAQGFVPWLQAASGQRFNVVYNGAQSGDTTANALDRLSRDCLAYSPQVVIMQTTGINDTSSGNGNIKEDTIFANQCSIVDQIVASNATLILLLLTPVVSGEARGTLTNMMRVIRLNQRLRDYCLNKPGVIVFDSHRRIVDPADTTGLALANYLRTGDKIHYSMRGAKFIADQLWTQISAYFPADFSTLPESVIDCYDNSAITLTSVSRTSNVVTATSASHGWQTGETGKVTGGSVSFNDYVTVTRVDANTLTFPLTGANGSITGTIKLGRSRNLFPYPLLSTTTGGTVVAPGTGTAAAGIRVQNSAGAAAFACSVASRSDGFGNNQVVAITPGAANDRVSIGADFAQYSTLWPTVVLAGREYYFEASVDLVDVSGSNLTQINFNVDATVDGVTYYSYATDGYAEGATLDADATGLHFRTARFLMPSGSITKFNWELILRFSAAGTALTVKIGRINLIEVPA